MMEPFTVVIPLYNKEKHIERALNSVLSQTVQDFEIIVVDDGSKDGSAGIVTGMGDGRIRLVRQENKGAAAARNRGIDEASNPLIAFLDADDQWQPDFLATISKLRMKYPEAGIYATAYQTSHVKSGIKKIAYANIPPAPWEGLIPDFFKSMQGGQPPVWTSAAVVPKEVFRRVGMFQTGEVIGEDVDMWVRIALKYPVAFSTNVCATYYLDADNRTYVQGTKLKKAEGYLRTLNTTANDQSIDESTRTSIARLGEMVELGYASSLILANEKKQGRSQLKSFKPVYLRRGKMMWLTLSYLPAPLTRLLLHIKQKLRQVVK
jgi:glycosyltransferase involved in cell wall biosynthesis